MRLTVLVVGAATLVPIWFFSVLTYIGSEVSDVFSADFDPQRSSASPSFWVVLLFGAAVAWTIGTLTANVAVDVARWSWIVSAMLLVLAAYGLTWVAVLPALLAGSLAILSVDSDPIDQSFQDMDWKMSDRFKRLEGATSGIDTKLTHAVSMMPAGNRQTVDEVRQMLDAFQARLDARLDAIDARQSATDGEPAAAD